MSFGCGLYKAGYEAGLQYTEYMELTRPLAWQLEARWTTIRDLQWPLMPAFMQLYWNLNAYLWGGERILLSYSALFEINKEHLNGMNTMAAF